MLHEILRQFRRDKSLFYWEACACLLTVGSVFLASTLLAEQRTAAFAYGRFALHWLTILGLTVWGTVYLTRLRQSEEMAFWLTLPLSRASILGRLIGAFAILAITMVGISSGLLWIFTRPSLLQITEFMLATGFEAGICAILTVYLSLSLKGSLKAPFGMILIILLGHILPSLELTLYSAYRIDDGLSKLLAFILAISPRFEAPLSFTCLLQNTSFTLLMGLLCTREFQRQAC